MVKIKTAFWKLPEFSQLCGNKSWVLSDGGRISGGEILGQRLQVKGHRTPSGFGGTWGNIPGAAEGKKHKLNEAHCRSFLQLRNDKPQHKAAKAAAVAVCPSDSSANTFHLFTCQLQRPLKNFSSWGFHHGITEEEQKTSSGAVTPDQLQPVSDAPYWYRHYFVIWIGSGCSWTSDAVRTRANCSCVVELYHELK